MIMDLVVSEFQSAFDGIMYFLKNVYFFWGGLQNCDLQFLNITLFVV